MTKKKIGAVMGRPEGSGEGLEKQVAVRMSPALYADLEKMAKELGKKPSSVMRDATIAVVERWKKTKQR